MRHSVDVVRTVPNLTRIPSAPVVHKRVVVDRGITGHVNAVTAPIQGVEPIDHVPFAPRRNTLAEGSTGSIVLIGEAHNGLIAIVIVQ